MEKTGRQKKWGIKNTGGKGKTPNLPGKTGHTYTQGKMGPLE